MIKIITKDGLETKSMSEFKAVDKAIKDAEENEKLFISILDQGGKGLIMLLEDIRFIRELQ